MGTLPEDKNRQSLEWVGDNTLVVRIRGQRRRSYRMDERPGVFALPSEKWWRDGKKPRRDSMREKCYVAERLVRVDMGGMKPTAPDGVVTEQLQEVGRYFRDLMETDWFQRRWPKFEKLTIQFGPRTRGAWASPQATADVSAYDKDGGTTYRLRGIPMSGHILFSRWALREEVVWLHELAHCIIPHGHKHDRLWVRTFLELVRLKMGREPYELLRKSFTSQRIRTTPFRVVEFSAEHKARLAACRPPRRRVS